MFARFLRRLLEIFSFFCPSFEEKNNLLTMGKFSAVYDRMKLKRKAVNKTLRWPFLEESNATGKYSGESELKHESLKFATEKSQRGEEIHYLLISPNLTPKAAFHMLLKSALTLVTLATDSNLLLVLQRRQIHSFGLWRRNIFPTSLFVQGTHSRCGSFS